MRSDEGDSPNDAFEQMVRQPIRDEKLQVTTRDTDALGGKVDRLDTKLNYALVVLAFIATLLLSTYGVSSFFAWRLVDTLLP